MTTNMPTFTPIFDCVTTYEYTTEQGEKKRLGVINSIAFGVVWRICQMGMDQSDTPKGKCKKTHDYLAKRAGISSRAIRRALKILVAEGFFIDETPNKRNGAHTYVDTGKVDIVTTVEARLRDDVRLDSQADRLDSQADCTNVRLDSQADRLDSQADRLDSQADELKRRKETLDTKNNDMGKKQVFSDDPISHLELKGATVYVIEGDQETPYHVKATPPKNLRVKTGEGPDDDKLISPEKLMVVYKNNGTCYRKVVLGEKEGELTDEQKPYYAKLCETFALNGVATKQVKVRHYSTLRELAINLEESHYVEVIDVWVDWMNQCKPSMTKSVGFFQQSIDDAVQWYKKSEGGE